MQMYDGLPIITNKVTVEEQQGVRHHLLGCVRLDEKSWTVGVFTKRARRTIGEIRERGNVPILVGGTHYYTQNLLLEDSLLVKSRDEIASEKEGEDLTTEEIKERWPVLEGPTEVLIDRLREVDPIMADRWHPKDRRKIRRSLEIFLMTGRKASDIYAEQQERRSVNRDLDSKGEGVLEAATELPSTLLFWVHADSAVLKKRLDARVDKMMEIGLLDEIKSMDAFLHNQGSGGLLVDRTRGIWASIGWKEFEPYLEALESGTASEQELQSLYNLSVEQMKAATRQYAKRQTRWIRLKLMPSLAEENALKQLYLLDGTDVSKWENNVSNLAIDITTNFFGGKELPPPEEICVAAKEILVPENKVLEKVTTWPRRECEICHVTAVTDVQWETHLKSRRHRGLIKKREKMQKNKVRSTFSDPAREDGSHSDASGTP